jgi:hypothetical protein
MNIPSEYRFEIRPGPAVDSGLKPDRIKEKIKEKKTRYDSVDLIRPGYNPLTFIIIFLLK